jgi:glycosyltransferase involved in cell wall biosynthesis
VRIVHAVRSDGFAGVERHVASLAATQVRAGHSVAVIGGDPAAMAAAIGHGPVPQRPASTVLETARAIDSWARCDVLHVHMTAAEVAAVLATRAWRVPVVSTRHFASRRGSGAGGRVVAAGVRRRVRAQISISAYVAEHVDGASTVVRTGVPGRPDARPAGHREQTVLVAQRLEVEKRTDVGVRAFAASGLAAQGWRLEIAGNGAQRPRLETLVRELDLTASVDFLGHRSDVEELMGRAGLLLATCPTEGLGLTVLEAMAHGLPVVAAAGGGHVETLGAADGALYSPVDPADAGRLLARLAADPAARDAYGRVLQAVQRERYTLEAQADATEAVYRSIL